MKKFPVSFLYLLIFISGGIAILYETIWFHNLSLIMGSTSLALTLILTSFMLGLGLGSLFFGKIADKKNPLKLYQILELGIGLFALFSLFLFSPLNYLYQILYDLFSSKPFFLNLFKFILSMLFLLPPTLFMGGTLPVAVKYLIRKFEKKGKAISTFYWVNTFGASLMALFAPLFFMLYFDMRILLLMGASVNFIIALFIFLLPPFQKIETIEEIEVKKEGKIPILPFLAFFLSGTASLSLETLWNRHLVLVFGGSIYTFGLILFLFLLGIVFGSIFFSFFKLSNLKSLRFFYFFILLSSFFLSITLFFFPKLSFFQLQLLSKLKLTFLNYNLVNLILTFFFIFPITFCFGVSFPAAISGLTEHFNTLGRKTGLLMAINSLGTALGPVILTFIILPLFNFQLSYKILILLLIFSALLMAIYLKEKYFHYFLFLIPIFLIFFLQKWETLNFLLGTPKAPQFAINIFKQMGGKINLSDLKVLWEKNDIEAHIAVLKNPGNIKSLIINGKADASDGADMFTQSLSGHIPFLFNREIKNVFLIGLGSGVTTHCVLTHPIEEIKSVEISPGVVEAAKEQFSHVNELCFQDKRSIIIASDGRQELALSKEKYDLIISEPSNPWLRGVASLFTVEFFEICKKRLTEKGILCQWLNLYNLSLENILNILNTIKAVFPEILCFYNRESNDLLFFASQKPLELKILNIDDFPEKAKYQLNSLGIYNLEQILERFLWNLNDLNFEPTMPENRDTHPWLELIAPKDVFQYKLEENIINAISLNKESRILISTNQFEKNILIEKNLQITKELFNINSNPSIISMTFYPYGEETLLKRKTGVFSEGGKVRVFSFWKTKKEDLNYYIKQFYEKIFFSLEEIKIGNKNLITIKENKNILFLEEKDIMNIVILKED